MCLFLRYRFNTGVYGADSLLPLLDARGTAGFREGRYRALISGYLWCVIQSVAAVGITSGFKRNPHVKLESRHQQMMSLYPVPAVFCHTSSTALLPREAAGPSACCEASSRLTRCRKPNQLEMFDPRRRGNRKDRNFNLSGHLISAFTASVIQEEQLLSFFESTAAETKTLCDQLTHR